MLIPKCGDQSYPHVMLRLKYAATLATMHLPVLMELMKKDPKNYTEYYNEKCDEYIDVLK
jgi:hypothetical protein